jgi:hypothetical protein
MAWLWDSWEEYTKNVRPVVADHPGVFRLAQQSSWFETEHRLWDSSERLEKACRALHELGFDGNENPPTADPKTIERAHRLVEDTVFAGESLLLYHKRLAKSDFSYGFLHQKDILDHWDRYEKSGRVAREIQQLMTDVRELRRGYRDFVSAEDRFLLDDLDLPLPLESDFRLARNLFSIGLDEVGLLIAGRGLEGVLRKIAAVRKIVLDAKGKLTPASEVDVYDLIEIMSRIRWKANGTRLVGPETNALLHYLRTIRNSGAHSARGGKGRPVGPRQTASLVAETANGLWKQVSATRARLVPTIVQKTW